MLADRLLILRPDNIGDVVLFSGALSHIRGHYPSARIVLCVKKAVKELVELCPYVDKIVAWESLSGPLFLTCGSIAKIKGMWHLNRIARQFRCKLMKSDIVLLPVRSPTPYPNGMHQIVRLIPAKEKIGISGDYCNQSPLEDRRARGYYTRRMNLNQGKKKEHELVVTHRFLRFLGINNSTDSLWPEFWTDDTDRMWAERMMPPKVPGEAILALAPGVRSVTGKFYPGRKYAQAISFLPDRSFHIVILGSEAEQSMCSEVELALKELNNVKIITNLAGKTTIRQLIECVRCCDLLISQETAALHMGVGLRKPTVGILGGGHYGRFYPWGNPVINRVVNKPMDCYWCNWKCKYSIMRCIQEIEPEKIAREIRIAMRNYAMS